MKEKELIGIKNAVLTASPKYRIDDEYVLVETKQGSYKVDFVLEYEVAHFGYCSGDDITPPYEDGNFKPIDVSNIEVFINGKFKEYNGLDYETIYETIKETVCVE